jgi:hypothetical protein
MTAAHRAAVHARASRGASSQALAPGAAKARGIHAKKS